ncbi:P-loop containing nucleoside triphosphate hydrolase protein [Lobosporangium transversale]|uniref:p-loop containing nucleoside triphosphate hydrolase protein n=1 Tax=Lobosporangium transversale TaxID=64571 RepID=A0A1Y2GD68_9FUNG|nr:P-loop containing nucleoside triphosphate hydrolase protein [Lobosporangium transversale]ORZ07536.1 P-loop containing nucleoside triphosphate hydrolase protein [Lobosporangium transversale]|eukprot:XP_021878043.1 P-loop containing nucleoside triphosphate hydrolase protein [Lobosporangium transversale]
MCSYEFQIEAAKALFGKIPDDRKHCRLERVKNKAYRGFTDGELNEDDGELNEDSDDGELNEDSGDADRPNVEGWILVEEPEIYNHNDIVVAVITKSFGDETGSKRYIGCLEHIYRDWQTGSNEYTFTFDAKISSSKEIDVLMWTIGNLTTYERIMNSLSNVDKMSCIPKVLLRGPATGISSLIDDTQHTQTDVPESMNTAQKVAITRATQGGPQDVVLVQGPPGCGKSTVIVEMVRLLTPRVQSSARVQVLVCAQTNVAVVDLAYKYITTNEPKSKFEYVMVMRPPKIIDSHKRTVLEPFTVTARYHQVVNAVLHTIIRVFGYTPFACHGSSARDEVKSIVATDFTSFVESGLIKLLPMRAREFLSGLPSADSAQMKPLIFGMRNELGPFFRRVDFKSLLELCGTGQGTDIPRSKPLPIYGWLKQALLRAASVAFCTINVGISATFWGTMTNLKYIVVDEAAQALEPDVTALMCVDSSFSRLILVGDPMQLPGYCTSNQGKREMMDRSLMERLQTYRLCHSTLLDVQYRMHQDICAFVSRTFYDNRLTSDKSIHDRNPVTTLPAVMHVMFLGSQASQSRITTTSVVNIDEARYIVAHVFSVLLSSRQKQAPLTNPVTKSSTFDKMAVTLPQKVEARQPAEAPTTTIGIICIYKPQANVIQYLVDRMLSQGAYKGLGFNIVVNTIDSFQGQECDIIYVALTRTTQVNDFMGDPNRVNVAISRARHHLIVVGDVSLSLTDKQGASLSYWHSLCVDKSSMIIEQKYIKNVPPYEGPESVTTMRTAAMPAAPATIKKLIARGLNATTSIWTIHYERLMIDPKTPQGIHILEYVVQALASGDFDTGNGGRTTRPLFRSKQKGAALFFVTRVCDKVCLAWTVIVHRQRQAIELFGIGDKTFVEKKVWPSLRRDNERQPEWELSASMSLWSSGTSVDLSKDMPKSTSLLYVPADIDPPATDVLADVSENGRMIDHGHIKAMASMRSRPIMILGGGGTGKTECMLGMIEQQLDMDADFDNMQLYLGATDSLANWSSMRLLKRESITEQGFKMVSFTSLPSLLTKLYIHGKLFVDRDVFRSEYMDAMPAMVRSIGADELYDAILARMDIEAQNSTRSRFLRSEHKTAHKVYKSIKALRGHIDAYDLHAFVKRDPQRVVAMASKIARIYLDEVQDISWTMWSVIEIMLSAGTSSVVCAGDFTQRLTPGIPVNGIKTLIYKHIPKSMKTIGFKKNYRSDPSIISLANRIQSYTRMREHAMEPSLYPQESSNSVRLVEIQDIKHENVADVLRYIGVPSNNYKAAIITSSSWAHRLRESLGKSHNVFSAYECKGLEFDLVVCWDLFNPSMDVKTSTLRRNMGTAALDRGNIEGDENFEIYLNHLYVTVTRARKHLIMVVPSCDRTSIMIRALGINDVVHYSEVQERGPLPEITLLVDELSVSDDDLRMAIVMRERGLLQQALNVFEQHGNAAQAGFTRALIHRKEHRLRGEDREIQLCISECYGVIEVLQQSTDSVLKIEDVKIFLTQALVADKQYAEACLLYKELEMEDELVACLIEAVESKSGDVVRLRDLIREKAIDISEHFKDNKRYAKFVVALMLVFKSSSVDIVQSMITHIPFKTGLTMMHNSLVEVNESIYPIWEVFRRRKSLQSKELTFLEWSLLRRLDGQYANEDLVYITSTGCLSESQSPMACLFVGPRNNKTTNTLSLHIQSGAMLKSCRSLEVPLRHAATKMRELSCPLTDFMALHYQLSGEEAMYLLVEAYKMHKLEMRGSEHQLALFRWCAKMCGDVLSARDLVILGCRILLRCLRSYAWDFLFGHLLFALRLVRSGSRNSGIIYFY